MSEPFGKPPSSEDGPQDEPAAEPKKVPALFDLRLIIGALFTLYGVVLIIAGIADGKAEISKASGIRINLWAGLGMLALGLVFLLWMALTGDGHDRPEREKSGGKATTSNAGQSSA